MAQFSKGVRVYQSKMFAGAVAGANPLGRLLFVDSANGNAGNDGESPEHPLASLSGALSAAQAGDTIILAPGGSETVTAALSVSVAQLKIVCPAKNPAAMYSISGAGTLDLLSVTGADVHVEGVRFAHTGATANQSCILLGAAADGAWIERCQFDDSAIATTFTGAGVEITDACNDVTIVGCEFRDLHRGVLYATATGTTQVGSLLKDCEFWVGKSTAWGVYSEPTGTGVVLGLRIEGCKFLELEGDGTVASDPWDGTTAQDGASGPIWLDADVDRAIIVGCRAHSVSDQPFAALCNIDTGTLLSFVDNQSGAVGGVLTGEADIDIDQADYTSAQALLTIAPDRCELRNVVVVFDLAKATTGFAGQHTTETVAFHIQRKVDGTNWRTELGTKTSAVTGTNAAGGAERVTIGHVGFGEQARVMVVLSAENAVDVEFPYALYYEGAEPPTLTAVAAA